MADKTCTTAVSAIMAIVFVYLGYFYAYAVSIKTVTIQFQYFVLLNYCSIVIHLCSVKDNNVIIQSGLLFID